MNNIIHLRDYQPKPFNVVRRGHKLVGVPVRRTAKSPVILLILIALASASLGFYLINHILP